MPSASSEQDRTLVEQALAGEEEAFAQLFSKYHRGIAFHVARMVPAQTSVEDLVQEIFIKAFTSLPSYSQEYAFSTWLYRIATNHVIDYLRKKKIPTFSIDQPPSPGEEEQRYEIPDTTYRPDRHIMASQQRNILEEAIEKLPPKYKRVIIMRHKQEMSYEEIARALELPLGTVKAHIFRARQLLYKYLRDRRDEM